MERAQVHRRASEPTFQHETVSGNNLSSLCNRCEVVDAEALFTIDGHNQVERKLIEFSLPNDHCALCRLFHAVVLSHDKLKTSRYDVYAVRGIFPLLPRDLVLLAVVPTSSAASASELIYKYGPSTGLIAWTTPQTRLSANPDTMSHDTQPGPADLALAIDQYAIDWSIVRSWLSRTKSCASYFKRYREHDHINIQDEYPQIMLPDDAQFPSDMRLIDCLQRMIVKADQPVEYCALSYVWGHKGSSESDWTSPKLPSKLPKTIEDAIIVTERLGYRYLWVDRYCIEQSDEVTRHSQISQMHLIYQNTSLTIIAAAAKDAESSLPGVSNVPRRHQPQAVVYGHRLASILPDEFGMIYSSKWHRRAWTYQEVFFSRRRLFFTAEQVYFESPLGGAYETIFGMPKGPFTSMFGGGSFEQLADFPARLAGYCGRTLTFPEDAISAFAGVLNALQRIKLPGHHSWVGKHYAGLPLTPYTYDFDFGEFKDDDFPEPTSVAESLVAALCWRSVGSGKRRSVFPSWTWAGWAVKLERSATSFQRKRNEVKSIEISVGSLGDESLEPLHERHLGEVRPQKILRVLSLELFTISLSIMPILPRTPESKWMNIVASAQRRRNLGVGFQAAQPSGYFALFESQACNFQAAFFSPFSIYRHGEAAEPFMADFDPSDILGIVMGHSRSDPAELANNFVMIVQKHDNGWERIGHCDVDLQYIRMLRPTSAPGPRMQQRITDAILHLGRWQQIKLI